MTIRIHRLGQYAGTAIEGVEIASGVDEPTFQQFRAAFRRHSVLVFHDQEITDEQQVAFSEGFGLLQMTMVNDLYGGGGPINRISNVNENDEIIPPEDKRMLYYFGNVPLELRRLLQAGAARRG